MLLQSINNNGNNNNDKKEEWEVVGVGRDKVVVIVAAADVTWINFTYSIGLVKTTK